jgi:putative ABC transport system permease protein
MKTGRLIASSLRALGRNKVRTTFMMLGTLIGVTALTVVIAIGQGTQQRVMDRFGRTFFAGSRVMIQAVVESRNDLARTGPVTNLTLEDLSIIQRRVPEVMAYDGLHYVGAGDFVFNGEGVRTAVRGHTERYPEVSHRGVTRGAFFTAADVRGAARVALVGQSLIERAFGDVDPMGQIVRVGNVPFEVIGVLDTIGMDPHGIDRDNEVIIPVSTMQRRVVNADFLHSGSLAVNPDAEIEEVEAEVVDVLRELHHIGGDEPNDFRTYTPVQVERLIKASNRVFTVLLPLVALISILIGAGVVANVMLMSVSDRKSEIGLRKALGARPRDIRFQFLLESSLVTTLGGLMAVLLGFAILTLVSMYSPVIGAYPLGATLLGLGVSVLVGIVAGVLPARRAAGLDPVDALR